MSFTIDNLIFDVKTENKIKNQSLTKIKGGEVCEYLLNIEFENEVSPKEYSLIWEEDQIDMLAFWSSKSSQQHNINPDWWMRKEESRTASGMPLMAIYNKKNINRELIAISDTANPTKLQAGVVEENGKIRFRIDLFDAICPKMSEYSVTIRIDKRAIPVTEAIMSTKEWWGGDTYIPNEATLPMYSCWYSFHQHTIPSEILEECKIAKELGMDTVIVDDGWQTDDNSRGYAFCGDWKICEKKIPDMQKFVDDIHALGMKFMVWFSVSFVGVESENYEKFKGKYLYTNNEKSILDIRFKEVRDFLVDTYVSYVKKYSWDGLKLDFIDSFRLTEESSTDYESMDTVSVEVALDRLLDEVTAKLKEINHEIL
ncbi:MAG: alpha-galactosidase, partial [Clostridia bacterium]|nr:alpha-galactosidase [Clostridia bacterium]